MLLTTSSSDYLISLSFLEPAIMSRSRPLKIHNALEDRTVGITARSLAEVKEKALDEFGFLPDTCRIFLEDRTEIVSNDYFLTLPDNTKLMVESERGEWITGTPGVTLN